MSMPMSAKVLRPLYKNLVRLAKRFDTNPVLKLHNTQHRSQYYNPGDFSCVQVIRALFRRALLQASTPGTTAGIGFEFYKKLNKALQNCERDIPYWKLLPPPSSFPGGRTLLEEEQGEGLVRVLPWTDRRKIRPGMLLISHPMLESYWGRKVILILNHGYFGSTGIVLGQQNHPNVWQGGPLGKKFLIWRKKDLFPGGNEICPGLYWAELSEERAQILPNVSTSDYRMYHGHCGWSEGQLASELVSGCWFTAGSPSLNEAFFRFQITESAKSDVAVTEELGIDPLHDLVQGEEHPITNVEPEPLTAETQLVIATGEEEFEATATMESSKPAKKTHPRCTKPDSTATLSVEQHIAVRNSDTGLNSPTTHAITANITSSTPTPMQTTTTTKSATAFTDLSLPELEEVPELMAECTESHRVWRKAVRMLGGEYALSLWMPLPDTIIRRPASFQE